MGSTPKSLFQTLLDVPDHVQRERTYILNMCHFPFSVVVLQIQLVNKVLFISR